MSEDRSAASGTVAEAVQNALLVLSLLMCGPIGVIIVLLSHWSWRTKAIAIAMWAILLGGVSGGYYAQHPPMPGQPTPYAGH